ncbi:outer membrane protein assembly factor BamB family protein [Mariniblastus fucicola]|uniref:Endo-1,4-beta-xylanase Z n=1 Tax=Mariniblastus fucicola TaxID=980251 RepID=A0A5B9P7A3_9BACT|nr:PQQ-binding-like beta-propeller repeat protein [Mariniblastus fucicola]QEG22204.1 Endo-1,4-beta-xylanase Z precursor [Mariniblastus fucicola]
MSRTLKFALPILFALLSFSPFGSNLRAQDWPALRGSKGDGIGSTDGKLSGLKPSLKIAWKKKLGSGYSSVSVAGDQAFTMYTSGDQDKLGCFDIKTGDTNWEFVLGEKFKGENGSFDGPISTPMVHDGMVYGLSCQGRFVCLNTKTGELIWEKSLAEDFKVKQPMYGFATSPLIAAGNLILMAGAKDKLLVSMDPKTGDEKWACGDDVINSQIPTLVEIDGVPVLLASGAKKLTGVNAESGQIVFEFEHGGGNGSAVMPVATDDGNVVITIDDGFSKAINLRPVDDQKIAASETWQQRSIKNTYNIPTLCNENLFAFSTRILTCVDPATGKPHWKSRKPGDGFLIAIDDHIAICTKEGSVHLATATPEKYDEVAKLKVFEDLVWTVPSFADNAIFIRSLGEIARVDIVPEANVATEGNNGNSLAMSDGFAGFLKSITDKNAAEATPIIDAYLAKQSSFPIVESGIVHFVYRGEEDDVALASDVFGARQERKMIKAGDSDLKYYTVKLESDQRANYFFLVNFKPQTDSLNPRSATSSVYAGEMEFAIRLRNEKPLVMSWFAMSDWEPPSYLSSLPEKLHGTIVQRELPAEGEGKPLPLSIYLPDGYEQQKDKRFPVVYVLPHMRFENSQFIESADNIFANTNGDVPPAILVIPQGRTGPGVEKKLVALIDAEFRTIAERDFRSIVGFGFTGGAAFGALANSPDLFGAIGTHSPLVFGSEGVLTGMESVDQPTRVYLDWGRYDMHNPVENWDMRKWDQEIFEALEQMDHITLSGGMANDSADWASWKNRYDKLLGAVIKTRE